MNRNPAHFLSDVVSGNYWQPRVYLSRPSILMRRFLFLLLLFSASLSKAQFSDSVKHYFQLSATGNLNRSNSATSYLFTNKARFKINNPHTRLNADASWLYGEQERNLTYNDFTTTADVNFYHDSSNLYYWALANYTTSYSLKINNQLQSGLGAAYNFVDKPSSWLNLSDGILYETSSLNTGNPDLDHYHTFRNSLRLSYNFAVTKVLTVSGTNFFQQALGNGDDYIVRLDNSLGVKLNKWITLTTNLTYNRFKRTGTDNLLLTYGLVAEGFFK